MLRNLALLKGSLILLLLCFPHLRSNAQCTGIATITCGTNTTTTIANAAGVWNGLFCGFSTPGKEILYSFTPTVTGVYNLTVTSAPSNLTYVDFGYKAQSGGCSATGWSCIIDVISTGTYTGPTLTAGVPYYIILDRETSGSGSLNVTWRMDCATAPFNPCATVTSVTCGTANSTTLTGAGAWATATCGITMSGKEAVYSFTPATTGAYTITTTSMTGAYTDFFYKVASGGCSATGWTCLADIQSPTTFPVATLTAGVQYLFLLDRELTSGSGVITWQVDCLSPPFDPCASIGALAACGTATTTAITSGTGAWDNYGSPYLTPGKEKLYTYTPTQTGSYSITQSSSTGYSDYFYKVASGGCNATGWTYIDDLTGVDFTPTFTLTAGVQYYFLIDPETITGTTPVWTLVCPPCVAPTVPTLSATSTTLCNPGSTTLSIASGTLNNATTWSWYSGSCGGTAAGTGTSIIVSPTTTTTYYARGTGGCVTPGSCGSITITVNQPVSISSQPATTQTLCAGAALNLSVTAANATGYQWYRNAVLIPGATASTYNVPSTTTANAGTYYVIISGTAPCGTLQSGNAVVNINARPTAVISGTTTICNGSSTTMSVTFTGTAPWTFNYFNGTTNTPVTTSLNPYTFSVAPSATTTYSITSLSDANCTSIAADYAGTATVTVNQPVSISSQPATTQTLCAGAALNLSVTAANATGYQWYRNAVLIPGATASTYNVPSTTIANAGTYYVIVSGTAPCGTLQSGNAVVNVNPRPTAVISGTTTICNGSSTTMSVTFTGTASWTFNYFNGTTNTPVTTSLNPYTFSVAPSATTTYSITSLSDANCTSIAADYAGTATVTVNNPVSISTQPAPTTTLCAGNALNLSVAASNATGYQWYKNTVLIPGATASTYNIPSVTTGNAGTYYVIVSGNAPCSTLQSNNAVVSVTPGAAITTQPPATVTVCNGSTLNITVVASNATGYQWYRNTVLIPGATSATYSVPNASVANAGTYNVIVSGAGPCGAATSNNTVVNINPRPTAILSANGATTVCNGTATAVKVSFTGTAPWTFTYFNGSTTTSVTTSTNPYIFSVSPSTTTTYTITSLVDANCTAIPADYAGTFTITVNPRPTAVLTANGPSSVCNGTFATMNITFTGTGPWTYTMTNGTTTWSNTTTSNPYTQFVLPSTTATYSITSLTDVNCSAIPADIASTYTIQVKPRPTAVFSVVGASTICNGSFAGLRITFTGTAPWTVEYTTGLTTTTVTTSQNPYNFFTLPTTNTTYSVSVLSDANCQATPADFAGSASVIVKQRPTAVITGGPSPICNGASVNMNVALTGLAPWTFQYYNGTNTTNVTTSSNSYNFTVTPTTNTTYSINLLTDANCVANPVDYATTAPIVVKPRPTATFSISGPSAVCNGSSTNINVNFTGTPPWTFNRFDGNNYTLVTTSLNPYTFPVSPSVNTTYSINLLIDANCTGIASDYASTATVTVKPRPTATLAVMGAATLCDGAASNISVALTGTGPWTFDRFDGITTTTVTTTFSPYIFSVSPSATTTYSITSLTDANCTAIAADIASTATLTVHPRPTVTVTGTTTVCEGTSTDINVALTGSAPWTFIRFDGTSNTPVTTSTNPYIFSVTPSTTATYSIASLSDANCVAMSGDYYGTATVTVNHAPALIVQPTAVTECSGVGTTLTAVATGTGLIYQWQLNGNAISDGPVYSGTNTSVLTINSVTGVSGTYDLMISGVCPPVIYTTPVTVTEDHNNTWSGAVDQNWSVTGNWSCGAIPIVTTDVLIPTNAVNMPLVDIPTAICNSLTIDPSASVMFTGTNNALEIKTAITHNGTFNASLGTVILSGTSSQNIPAITYKNLQIDGGSAKLLEGNITITGYLNLVNGHILIGGYDLTLDVPVQAIGGNANSFIVTNDTGVVIGKNMGVGGNPDAAMFHVGTTTSSYTPIMLENLGTADDYSVRVIPNVFEDGYGVDPITVTNPVVDRTWLVDEAVAGGSYVNMNPYWNTAEQINGFDQTHVYVVHYTGGEWVGLTDSALGAPPAGTSGGMYYADADSIQSFSPFTVASIGQFPLAIKLSDISAANVGNRNRVNFSSASEDKGDVYNIERSVDGKIFTQIGSIKAKGEASTYTYWDANPVTGKNFYRLRLEAKGASTTYSKVVSATVKGGDALFSINAYPNPVEGKVSITVNGDIAGKGTITVTDMNGKVVRTAQQITGGSIDIDLGGVVHGLYFIKYSDDIHNESIKVNKK